MIWKWISKRSRDKTRCGSAAAVTRRSLGPERLEPRRLMAADPIHVGIVYIETDYLESDQDVGSDSQGDRFILSFTGGAPDTELSRLRIRTDKDGDGITIGDPLFDTALGARGKNGAHGFQIVQLLTADGRSAEATAEVDDGGQELVLSFKNFRAGDRLEFTMDVDEVLRLSADLDMFNSRLDVITSGQEFQDSILQADFEAPHYEQASADAVFLNDFGSPSQSHGLDLPPDEGDGASSRPNRSAAALASTVQVPKPIEISGHVWLDNDLDLVREPSERGISGVALSLYRHDATTGDFVDTGHRVSTGADGSYHFPKSLGLAPGTYRVVEAQPRGLLNVGAVAGTVDGSASGSVESDNVLTDILIPLGDQAAVGYDFAEAQPAQLSGSVYRDDNDNGSRDSGEVGLGGIRVQLVPVSTISAQESVTVTTAADGSYSFLGLAPGTYQVIELDQPAHLTDGTDAAGSVDEQTVGIAENPGDRIRGIVLQGGDIGVDYNFGELPLGSVSGFVYLAAPGEDCSGAHEDDGATRLPGVELVLETVDGQFIARTTTGSDGGYTFDQLPKGTYRIIESTPAGLLDGGSHVGNMSDIQVGVSAGGGMLTGIVLPAGGHGTQYNFCEAAPATISGYVYHDRSDDGARDAGEGGIANTTVRLVDSGGATVATTTADESGFYRFQDVVPGEYTIAETQPEGFFDGIDTPGLVDGQPRGTAGADGDSLTSIVVKQGQSAVQYNFGELLGASLSGRVHVDVDADCVFDRDEKPLAGVVVRILDSSGAEVARTVSAADGTYTFSNLKPGQYTVVEETPAGLFEGGAEPGSAGGVVDGPNRIGEIMLASGEVAVDYDFCERPPAEISGVVFTDRNGDSLRGADEPVISDVVIELYDETGNLVASAVSDAAGKYRFSHLPAGSYTLREIQPTGYLQGDQVAGSHGGDDSQTDVIAMIPIGWGDRLTQYNFCEIEPGSVSGSVYIDADGDCIRDPDEQPLPGVTIDLYDASGTLVATTITNAAGDYDFEGLPPGRYEIVEHQPQGYYQGSQTLGSAGGEVLGPDHLALTLPTGMDVVGYDFCEKNPSSLSGSVYVDVDGDWVEDDAEVPLEDVRIDLYDLDGKPVATTYTDANGDYRFDGLAPGRYQVVEHQPDGYLQGGQTLGSVGGEIIGEDHMSVTLDAGIDAIDYDFCENNPASLSGSVYVDADGDRVEDANELPLQGVRIDLLDASGNRIARTTTDASGNYRFDGLAPGRYQVVEHQPDGYFQGGQTLGSVGGEILGEDRMSVTLAAGIDAVDYDFCENNPASISGRVFVDQDGDCSEDAGEPPLAGVRIDLIDASGNRIGTTTTDDSGDYRFDGLAAGQYHIVEHQPDGFYQGGQSLGSGGGEIVGEDEMSLVVAAGMNLVDYNFCELPPSTISGSVWRETDLNRRFNPGETPLAGVVVELMDGAGQVISHTRTDAQGRYEFDSLAPGVYAIRESQPVGLFHGGEVAGTLGGRSGGDDMLVGINLPANTHADGYNFPEVAPAVISGYVFQDGDALVIGEAPPPDQLRQYRDGLLSDDDTPLGGVTLELRTILGQSLTGDRTLPGSYADGPIRVVTDANGYYSFVGLRPGTYHVYQLQPDDYTDGLDTAGSTGGLAVNPADVIATPKDQILIQTLAANELTDPGHDAILSITLSAGAVSTDNNFSEIRIDPVPPPPQLAVAPQEEAQVLVPVETFETQVRIVAFASPNVQRQPMFMAEDNWAVSWHLSVINGGFPRGADLENNLVTEAAFQRFGLNPGDGTSEGRDLDQGRWTIGTLEGEVRNDQLITLGEIDAVALTGDFDGDGQDDAAIFSGGQWLVDLNGNGRWDKGDLWIRLGTSMDRPVVGDWDGDGKDDIGIFGRRWQRDSERIVRDPGLPDPDNKRRRTVHRQQAAGQERIEENDKHKRLLRRGTQGPLRADAVDHVFNYGEQVDTPMVGDWNGDGIDQIAVFRSGQWLLDGDGDGRCHKDDELAEYGQPGDEPIAGDFNGDGIDEIGVVRGETWIIDTDGDRKLTANDLHVHLPRQDSESQPIVGDFDGDGKDEPGFYDEAA